VFVKNLTGRTTSISCTLGETVEEFKYHLQDHEGIPVKEMRLTFAGKQLEDDRTLRDYGVSKESTLHLVVRLKGC
jgi:hypothetical protein